MATNGHRKRPSRTGGPPLKAIKPDPDLKVPVDALLKEHVRLFDRWMLPGFLVGLRFILSHLASCCLLPEVVEISFKTNLGQASSKITKALIATLRRF